ncbi:putative mitochondrial protein [Sesamum angolense]|uniref:Mitochondrial protein n=1 Tax=Sesamum angolense TaxID=2727404 RepID=A0AAE1XA21_9LAMI|nr:putative mitochondrial protein [Sesamum angolense]
MLGGKQFGSLLPERGLRQGDPLSPNLFLLCTKSFSSLLQNAEREDHLQGIAVCWGAPSITHLFFIDDTLIFGQASPNLLIRSKGCWRLTGGLLGKRLISPNHRWHFSRNTDDELCLSIDSDHSKGEQDGTIFRPSLENHSLKKGSICYTSGSD